MHKFYVKAAKQLIAGIAQYSTHEAHPVRGSGCMPSPRIYDLWECICWLFTS